MARFFRRSPRPGTAPRRARPFLEGLEGRNPPSTLPVAEVLNSPFAETPAQAAAARGDEPGASAEVIGSRPTDATAPGGDGPGRGPTPAFKGGDDPLSAVPRAADEDAWALM